MLHAPETGPHPANKDADTDPIAYAHKRVILATPKTFETTAVKAVPEPETVLLMIVLSETHSCFPDVVQESNLMECDENCPTRTDGVAECNDAPLPLMLISIDADLGRLTSDILETLRKSVTFPLLETRFPIDVTISESTWDLADLQKTEESDFQRFASHEEKCTRNFGVEDKVPRDFPNI
jgi:hypothetical protein